MHESATKILSALTNKRTAVILTLSFSSGLPLALTGGTLQAWLATTTIDIKTIGIFSLVGLPYTLKFFWAPVMDRYVPPLLGRRRGWMLITQLLLILFITSIAFTEPEQMIMVMGLLAVSIAFISASQDIAINAYTVDVLKEEERGIGSAMSVIGYRIALIVSGGLALMLADQLGWKFTYCLMAAFITVGVISSFMGPEPVWKVEPPPNILEAIIKPFMEFFSRPQALLLLILIVLYKLGDAFAGTLTTAFLIRGLEFSLTDVGFINKWLGMVTTIIGAMLGGVLLVNIRLYKCLFWFAILQAVTNLGFMFLAMAGKSYIGMVSVIVLENLSGGMGTAAFTALLFTLCNHRYTATQFALLSALSAVGRVFVGPPAGVLVDTIGWAQFFFITFLVAIPCIVLLVYMRKTIESYHHTDNINNHQETP